MTTEQTATETADQTQATSTGEQDNKSAQPTLEERLKESEARAVEAEAKRQEAVREMNEKQRLAAEKEKEVDHIRFERDQLALAAAQNVSRKTILDDINEQVQQAIRDGDELKATRLSAERATLIAEARTLQNSVNAVKTIISAHGPSLTAAEKAELASDLYIDGDPKRGFRDVATVERFLADPDKVIRDAKLKAKGLEVESGEYDRRLLQKQEEGAKLKEAEIKRQQSITEGAGGAPPDKASLKEQKKKEDDDYNKSLQEAERPL